MSTIVITGSAGLIGSAAAQFFCRQGAWSYAETSRGGDHVWWISDVGKFGEHSPGWRPRHGLRAILVQIFENNTGRRV